jgi:hypothetical protein
MRSSGRQARPPKAVHHFVLGHAALSPPHVRRQHDDASLGQCPVALTHMPAGRLLAPRVRWWAGITHHRTLNGQGQGTDSAA